MDYKASKWQLALIVALSVMMTGCMGCTRVSPGYVGIKSTYAGSGRGLEGVAVGPAWVFYNPWTESIFEYPTYAKTAVWTHSKTEGSPNNEEITFTNKNKMQIAVDVSLGYQVLPEGAAAFYLKFRNDDLNDFTNGLMRNWAREKFDEAAGKYDIDQIMGDNAVFVKEVRQAFQAELTPIGIKLIQFGLIGAPRPPANVKEGIDLAVHATQLAIQKQNEIVQAEADAKKMIAQAEGDAKSTLTRAEAQAKANVLLSNSITPTLVEYRKLEKWDGKLSYVSGESSGILLNLGK